MTSRSIYTTCMICSTLLASGGCTERDPSYCDPQTPCPAGKACNPTSHTCEVAHDAAVDARPPDAGPPDRPLLTESGKLMLGASCGTDDSLCTSAFCVDGVCCEARCDGSCRSCALPGKLGTCTLASSGDDPRKSCGGSGACAGSCDGKGSCTFPDDKKVCATATCAAGKLTQSHCDGKGVCTPQTTDCGGYACTTAGDACKTSCTPGGSDCVGTFSCVGGKCVNQLPLGDVCGTNDAACASGHCVDGVCCSSGPCGPCKACNLAGKLGTCNAVTDGTSCGATTCTGGAKKTPTCQTGSCATASTSCAPYQCNAAATACLTACSSQADCAAGNYCDVVTCKAKKGNGVTCVNPVECTSNICTATEKVCCDTACAGDCETCAGKTSCSAKPVNTPCGTKQPYCDDKPTTSAIKAQRCDAAKSCNVVTVSACDPYRCVASGGTPACSASCASHAACTTGLCDLLDKKNTCPAASSICYANSAITCPGAGSQASPYCLIQSCLDAAKLYVAVANGTYYENLALKAVAHLVSTGTVGPIHPVAGGLPQPNVAKVLLRPGSTSAAGIDLATFAAQIYGFDVRHASTGLGPLLHAKPSSALTLQTCHFAECKGTSDIAVFAQNAAATLTDVAIDGCPTGIKFEGLGARSVVQSSIGALCGTGILQDSGSLKLRDVLIAWNTGDGLFTYSVALDIDRVKIGAQLAGWGMNLQNNTSGVISNTQINDNAKGGINLYFNTAAPTFYNVTVVNNGGKEMQCDTHASGVDASVFNSILWDDKSSPASNAWSDKCKFYYSDVQCVSCSAGTADLVPGSSNINKLPQFTSATDYTLVGTSPCVDAGLDTAPSMPPFTTDLAAKPRFVDKIPGGAKIDMGAFEVQ